MPISRSPEETFALGVAAGGAAQIRNVFALTGDLGAGKTQFVKGFVAGVGSEAEVTSPTFTLVHEYIGGRLPVYHFDFYRLDAAESVIALGFDEYVDGVGVCVIEWADRFREILPKRASWISVRSTSEFVRELEGLTLP